MGNDEPVTPVFPNSDYWYVLTLLVTVRQGPSSRIGQTI